MSARLYNLLLRAYPASFRARFGDAMALAFLQDGRLARTRGWMRLVAFWTTAVVQAVWFGLLERLRIRPRNEARLARRRGGRRRVSFDVGELRRALRSLRARRWSALATVSLLSIALALATVGFSLADSYLFHRLPYPNADRLVELRGVKPTGGCCYPLAAETVAAWRTQPDVFSAVHAHLAEPIEISSNGSTSYLWIDRVTPGLLEMMGARARWGRLFTDADARADAPGVVVLAEELARRQFGSPDRAIGAVVAGAPEPLTVVGIVPSDFTGPTTTTRAWRASSMAAIGPMGATGRNGRRNFALALLPSGRTTASLNRFLRERSVSVDGAMSSDSSYVTAAYPLEPALSLKTADAFVLGLVGSAWCLLLAAWAAVAGIEVSGVAARLRRQAIQLALGASRTRLALGLSVEMLAECVLAIGLAVWLSHLGLTLLSANHAQIGLQGFTSLRNVVDFDSRAVTFMAIVAVVSWLAALTPVLVLARRADPMRVLSRSTRTTSGGSSVVRRSLTVVQVALAVALLSFAVLCVRTYVSLETLEKGFDPRNLAFAVWNPGIKGASARGEVDAVIERLRLRSDVEGVVRSAQDPFRMRHGMPFAVEIEGRGQGAWGRPNLRTNLVEPGYFETMRLPIIRGRAFGASEPDGSVIVSQAFAQKFSPDAEILGARVRLGAGEPWRQVVGVVPRVRHAADGIASKYQQEYEVYEPLTPAVADALPVAYMVVRLSAPSPGAVIREAIRDVDPKANIRLDIMDDVLSRHIAKQRSMMSIATIYGAMSLFVAMAGLYAVMSALVATRTREIGIRVALGATPRDVRQLVFGSYLRLIAAGAVLGVVAAIVGAKYVSSLFYGVTIRDPVTHVSVAALLALTALVATWQPTRRAARIDPAITLRDE
jgi:putative ABC transport system permease protein